MQPDNVSRTVFEYLYRDAANYKAYGSLLLRGVFIEKYEHEIQRSCEDSEYFVAEQITIPSLCGLLWEQCQGPTEDDHGWHEFLCLRVATVDECATLEEWGALDDLLQRFKAVEKWDLRFSPNA